MKIHVYATCYNEEALLPYFLRHYGSFADKITIFDDQSTDASCRIMAGHPKVECIQGKPVYSNASREVSETLLLEIKNEAYKMSRGSADWVFVVDLDEFIYHPAMRALLERYQQTGITLPAVEGYEMVSDSIPSTGGQIYEEIHVGFRNRGYCKNAVFTPDLDIGYLPGCHSCRPKGTVRTSELAELKLLHYRFLGAEYFSKRYADRQSRLSAENMRNGWATFLTVPGASGGRMLHCSTIEQLTKYYSEVLGEQTIEEVLSAGPRPALTHLEPTTPDSSAPASSPGV